MITKKIHSLILCLNLVFGSVLFSLAAEKQIAENTIWHEASEFTLEGQGWKDVAHFYDRLPQKAEENVRPELWTLSQHSAGLTISFATDAKQIEARWKVRFENHFPHMADAGLKGLDLYSWSEENKRWLWAGKGFSWKKQNPAQVTMVKDLDGAPRKFLLYLPLYDAVDSLEIGIPDSAQISSIQIKRTEPQPLVFYGTSITQGGCASRAGMAYPAIIGRALNMETINLGFSGNGRMDMALADLLSELDASCYVIDCLPNMTLNQITERVEPFISKIHIEKPEIPIVLIDNIRYQDYWLKQKTRTDVESENEAFFKAYESLRKKGIQRLYYVHADKLLGNDFEATVDGVHFTDLGFSRFSEGLIPILKKILEEKSQ